jgi:hypothetical protein
MARLITMGTRIALILSSIFICVYPRGVGNLLTDKCNSQFRIDLTEDYISPCGQILHIGEMTDFLPDWAGAGSRR